MTPEQRVEDDIHDFEEMANVIYQAETAKLLLGALKENVSVLTEVHKQRLLSACEAGMKINPENSKEWSLFKRFKEEDVPNLFQSP